MCCCRSANFNPRAYARHDIPIPAWCPKRGISIHVPTRGTTSRPGSVPGAAEISIHVPTRGTTSQSCQPHSSRLFQSTCLREARHDAPATVRLRCLFQSTCLREARRMIVQHGTPPTHFNPRAYARHDGGGGPYGRGTLISIHVPTRGTTTGG